MKKSLLIGIIGLTAGVVSSYGQGYINLDNYFTNNGSAGPGFILYGPNVFANGVSGALGTLNGKIGAGWTVGIYFVGGTQSIVDPAGSGIPNAALALGTGTGSSTTSFFSSTAGTFSAAQAWNSGSVLNTTITAEIVAFDTAGGTYANAGFRGHSAPFSMPTALFTAPSKPGVGDFFTSFQVLQVPEPTTLALAGLGSLSLLLFRRKQA